MSNLPSEKNTVVITKQQTREEQPSIEFGWGKYRPKCLQFLNGPRWFLVAAVIYLLCQGIPVLGLTTFVLPSIERRFALTSKELGVIAAANDISALLLVVLISFYGGYGNKIKWIGGGATFIGCGLILFSLPHFIVGPYKPVVTRASGLCLLTNTTINPGSQQCKVPSGGEWYYMMIFVFAQLIIGAGLSPLHSLLPAYLDENVEPKAMPIYLGLYYCATYLGPGVGYFIGGKFLSIYVDIDQPVGLNLIPKHPNWIGAWWLGFLVFGLAVLLCSVLILGFPRELPKAKERRLEHIRQGNIRNVDGMEEPRLRDVLPELKNLLTNWTFLFNSMAVTLVLLYGPSVAVFISKIVRLKFGLDPLTSSYVLSSVSVLGLGVGIFGGALTVRMFSLKTTCKSAALMCFITGLISSFTPLMFLVEGCENSNLAGVATPYHDEARNVSSPTSPATFSDLPLKSLCNTNCRCTLAKFFSPVCGSDSVTYFDACHAGCTARLPNKTFTNCSCIPSARTNLLLGGSAKPGYCDRKCKNVIIFAVIAAFTLAIQYSAAVPGRTVTLRCVPDNKRAFAIGIQYVMYKTFGLLPGPIIFGHLVDLSCRLWQDSCGEKGRCFDYDIEELSRSICIYGVALLLVASTFYFISWHFCKPRAICEVAPGDNNGYATKPRNADSTSRDQETFL